MLYISSPETLFVSIPRTDDAPFGGAVLTMVGTVSRKTFVVPVVEISVDGDYYSVRADFGAIDAPGEYEYRLTAGDATLASGVACAGQLPTVEHTQYETEKEYQQYE
ncbi:MAG: hypothetical protein K6A62_04710 [Bacteroidales bacterium]|nr:hypothetical protein [Bacteroidales bacterium]